MKKLLCFLGSIVITGFLATALVIPSPAMAVSPVIVTVHLENSGGSSLSGGMAQYYSSGWYTIGTTDVSGNVTISLAAGTYPFRITYAGGSNQKSQNISSDPTVVFKTVSTTVELRNSSNVLIDTGTVQYYANGWKTFGSGTTSGGQVSTELLPNNYPFRMTYAGGSNQKSQNISSTPMVVFQTVNATVQLKDSSNAGLTGGIIQYYASGWKVFGTTDGSGNTNLELLSSNYPFRVTYQGGSNQKSQDIGSNPTVAFQTVNATVQLKNSYGTLIDTGSVQYYASGWKIFGTTGNTSGGQVTTELLPNNYPFRMTYVGGSNQKSQDIGSSPIVVFQTQNATVTLKTCLGVGLSGGEVQYYASGWKVFGTTNGSGSTSMELLPNAYPFRITYQGGSNQKSQDISSPVNFTTTKVTLVYDGNIQYYASGWKKFTKPSMELLPNNYPFRFGKTQVTLNIAGCTFEQTMVVIKLIDSHGAGLSGGTAKYYKGGWQDILGATDSQGILAYGIPSALTGSTLFQMNYAYGSNQKSQNVSADSTVIFQTVNTVVQLKDSNGNPLDTGNVQYYANGWRTFGSGSTSGGQVSMELLPTSYSFIMTYAYATNQTSKTISIADSMVVFQTVNAVVQLKNSSGSLIDTGAVEYYANGWRTFGSGITSGGQVLMELLPNNYPFRMTYAYASNQKSQNVGTDQTVVFQTVNTNVQLKDHNGNPLDTGNVQYYANGWRTFGSGSTSGGQVSMELLPNNYPFSMTYAGGSNQKSQDVGVDSIVVFQTGSVHSDSGTATQYYASGWKPFAQDMELLPNSYPFKFSDGTPQTSYAIVQAIQNHIH